MNATFVSPVEELPAPEVQPSQGGHIEYKEVEGRKGQIVIRHDPKIQPGMRIRWRVAGYGTYMGSFVVGEVKEQYTFGLIDLVFHNATLSASYDLWKDDQHLYTSQVRSYSVSGFPRRDGAQ